MVFRFQVSSLIGRISFFGKDPIVFPAGLKGRPNLALGNALGTTSQSGQALHGRTKSARFEPPLQRAGPSAGCVPKAALADSLCLGLS
jgi:hypothetical protein